MKCRICGREAGGMSIPLGDPDPKKWMFECRNCGDTWTASLVSVVQENAEVQKPWWRFW